jgi:hypothetical protein
MLRQISLATLAAMFIAGSVVVARAEIGEREGGNTSAGMQGHWRATHGGDPFATPSASTSAYGYAPETTDYVPQKTPARPHHGRTDVGMKHHN